MAAAVKVLVFDFDGTLVDSDEALVRPLLDLGVAREEIGFGHAVAEECARLGISMAAFVDRYDVEVVQPFPGVDEVVQMLGRWGLCSNKHPESGVAELVRLGWIPEVAMFADSFEWVHKSLPPMLEAMDVGAEEIVMVGDSAGDVRIAEEIGCRYVWAGWNPRVAAARPAGVVLDRPAQLLDLYD